MKKILLAIILVLLMTGCTTQTNNEDEFVVGLECNYAPFNWMQPEKSETSVYVEGAGAYCDGYDVRIASDIATQMDKTLVIKQINWEGLIPALQSNEIDAIIAGMSNTPERSLEVLFTQPYYVSDYVILVKNTSVYAGATSIQDFSSASLIGQTNTAYDVIIDQIEGVNHLTPLGSYPLIVHALISGAADGAPAEKPTALAIVEANPELTFVEFTQGQGFTQTEETTTEVSIAVKLESTELAQQINDALATISQETREQYMNEAIVSQGDNQ